MSDSTPSWRILALATLSFVAATVVGTGGCGHTSAVPGMTSSPTPTPSASPSGSPTASPSPTATANVFVSMAYASMSPTIDPVYGQVDGYAQISPPPTPVVSPTPTPSPKPSPGPTQTPGPSSVLSVPCNTNIVFMNFEPNSVHSASLLNPPTGPFPPHFNNNNGPTQSVLGTPISNTNFSTGYVGNFGTGVGRSLVYSTGSLKGTFYFGDVIKYDSAPSMRTVITVNC